MGKTKLYFASDFHLGIPDRKRSLEREKKLVEWLDKVAEDASEIFLMGDVFDFWFEYRNVVPKGYVRLLGKIAELTDAGIPVHLFRGNHDIWAFDYLDKEVGMQLHRKPVTRTFGDHTLFLAHGDGLGPGDLGYKFLKKVFEFKPNQFMFRWLHPDLGSRMGLYFSKKSRLAHVAEEGKSDNKSIHNEERLIHYAEEQAGIYPEISYFIFGHRHIPLIQKVSKDASVVILGDWLTHFSYGVFEDGNMKIEHFE